MKFVLKGPFRENIYNLMRKIGYHFQSENKDYNPPTASSRLRRAPEAEFIFTRPPRGYPRFHIYLKTKGGDLIFNLHLDQKMPTYKGAAAHSGEYEGKLIEKEVEKIKQLLK